MKLVVQKRQLPTRHGKRGKLLKVPIIHIFDEETGETLCGISAGAALLTRIAPDQAVSFLARCYGCCWWMKSLEIPPEIVKVMEKKA